jgi:hypothetical protein
MSRIDISIDMKVDGWLLQAGGRGNEWGVTANGCRISFWGHENVLELESADGKCTKAHSIVLWSSLT